MKCSRIGIAFVFVIGFLVTTATHASQIIIGSDGINSAGLTLFNGNLLTGSGIAIGQVGPRRPGMMGVDPASKRRPSVNPAAVFRQDGTANVADTDGHAEQVAGILISTDATATGVATGASLYASAFTVPANILDPNTTISNPARVALEQNKELEYLQAV